MDMQVYHVRRNGMKYEVVETTIYDSGHHKLGEVVATFNEKYDAIKKADELNGG